MFLSGASDVNFFHCVLLHSAHAIPQWSHTHFVYVTSTSERNAVYLEFMEGES